MDVPAVLELSLLGVGFDVLPVSLVQGFLFCVQNPEPFPQPEKFKDNVREIEPAGGLQQLLGVQCHGFSDNWKCDRRWDDVMNTQVIQVLGWEIGEHGEDLPTFEFQQSRGGRGILGMRKQPLNNWQDSCKPKDVGVALL